MRARLAAAVMLAVAASLPASAWAQTARVVDVPTRPGVTARVLYVAPDRAKAAAILFAGGAGFVGIAPNGRIANGENFLVRTRALFADAGIAVAVLDAPSDRQREPYLNGFRQTPEHVADVRAVIAWMRATTQLPVWLIGTSRGTQSVAFAATQLPNAAAGGPDGIVLTSTILVGANAQDRAVPQMPLARIAVPVLVVHHVHDGCAQCPFADTARLMPSFTGTPRSELIALDGGSSTGDPCQARAYHGFNGIESDAVHRIAAWIPG